MIIIGEINCVSVLREKSSIIVILIDLICFDCRIEVKRKFEERFFLE